MCKSCGRKFEDGSEAKAVRELPYCPYVKFSFQPSIIFF